MRALLLLPLLWWTALARAEEPLPQLAPWALSAGEEPVPAEYLDPPDAKYHALELREAAPFAGVLLDNATAARWTARVTWCDEARATTGRSLRKLLYGMLYADERLRAAQQASYEREILGLREDLRNQARAFEAAKQPPFWKTRGFGMVVGFVLGAAATVAITYAAH